MTDRSPATRRRAPARAYLLAALVGVVASASVAALLAVQRAETDRPVAFAITMLVMLPISLTLGWVLFVAQHTVEEDAHAEDNVEARWLDAALAKTAGDTFVLVGLGAGAAAILGERLAISAATALTVVAVAMLVDVIVRYTTLRRRGA